MTSKKTIDLLVSVLVERVKPLQKQQPLLAAWTVGQLIVQEEQELDRELIGVDFNVLATKLGENDLSFPKNKLKKLRLFYQVFPDWKHLYPELSWTHYYLLLQLKNKTARRFYLEQAARNHWSTRELKRQINAFSFERIKTYSKESNVRNDHALAIAQMIKENYVLEFTGLPKQGPFLERELEQALLNQLQYFMLELGTGFAFVSRQKRIVTESGKQFYIDLVFYHVIRKCYVLVDLKIGELSHRDIGQMDMYVRLYDDKYRGAKDDDTVGIILCTEKDHTLVKYSQLQESQRLFASTYVLYLPTP